MARSTTEPPPSREELEAMHAFYGQGGLDRQMAPHIVYDFDTCPYAGCSQRMQAIDFRLDSYGPAVRDPLIRDWWSDVGFVDRCPRCGDWVHFSIRGKRTVTADEAAGLPHLPDDWHAVALIL